MSGVLKSFAGAVVSIGQRAKAPDSGGASDSATWNSRLPDFKAAMNEIDTLNRQHHEGTQSISKQLRNCDLSIGQVPRELSRSFEQRRKIHGCGKLNVERVSEPGTPNFEPL